MLHVDPRGLPPYGDAMLTRGGVAVTVRFARERDAEALQAYFRGLSPRSRYNRLMGAASELPAGQLDAFTHWYDDGRFSVLALVNVEGDERIVGEARYALDEETMRLELGLSVADDWHGRGLGLVLLENLQRRAVALGAEWMFGDTLRTNDAMLALARKAGFTFAPTPGDWKQMRFEKQVGVVQPAANWPIRAEAVGLLPLSRSGSPHERSDMRGLP